MPDDIIWRADQHTIAMEAKGDISKEEYDRMWGNDDAYCTRLEISKEQAGVRDDISNE